MRKTKSLYVGGVCMERILAYAMSVEFTKDEINQMENLLSDFLKAHNITLTVPVDVFALATELGFDVRGAEFKDNLDGLVLVDESIDKIEPFDSNKVIAYNCQKSINHKKFVVGHELAHYIEEKADNTGNNIVCAARDHSDVEPSYSNNREEQRKDYLSAALLMPREILVERYNKNQIENTNEFYKKIADEFKVSEVMAKRRIEEVFNGR